MISHWLVMEWYGAIKIDNKMNDKCIIPLLSLKEVQNYDQNTFYGVCSDFIEQCKKSMRINDERRM